MDRTLLADTLPRSTTQWTRHETPVSKGLTRLQAIASPLGVSVYRNSRNGYDVWADAAPEKGIEVCRNLREAEAYLPEFADAVRVARSH